MVEEIAFDPVQVHSPGWAPLARRAAAQLRGLSPVIRETRSGLAIRCSLENAPAARRRMLARLLRHYREAAAWTCQICGAHGPSVAAPPGSRLRLCPVHRAQAGAPGIPTAPGSRYNRGRSPAVAAGGPG